MTQVLSLEQLQQIIESSRPRLTDTTVVKALRLHLVDGVAVPWACSLVDADRAMVEEQVRKVLNRAKKMGLLAAAPKERASRRPVEGAPAPSSQALPENAPAQAQRAQPQPTAYPEEKSFVVELLKDGFTWPSIQEYLRDSVVRPEMMFTAEEMAELPL